MPRCVVAVCIVTASLIFSNAAQAQTSDFRLRGFADVGSTSFSANQSFTAVLGTARGVVFGGGVETVFLQRVFVHLRASRFRRTGQRVFQFGTERFGLGIPTTVTVTPVELTGGYRFGTRRLVPYAGGGVGWHGYREESRFADDAENVRDRFVGYHLVAGAEVRIARWLGAGVEAQWSTVPDALGTDPNSVSREFGESNLGGATVRAKFVVGR